MNTATLTSRPLVGRILLALIFIPAGFGKIGGFAGTAGYIASKGLPLPEVGAAIAIAVELVAGIALLIGWKTRWAALLLPSSRLVGHVLLPQLLGRARRPADGADADVQEEHRRHRGPAGALRLRAGPALGRPGLTGRRGARRPARAAVRAAHNGRLLTSSRQSIGVIDPPVPILVAPPALARAFRTETP